MRLRARVFVLLSAFLVVLSLSAALVRAVVEQRDQALQEAIAIDAAQSDTAGVLSGLVDQQSALRAYVTTRAPTYLQDYEAANAATARRIGRLGEALGEHEALHDPLRALESSNARWSAAVAAGELELMRTGQVDAARVQLGSRLSRSLYGQVRSDTIALQSGIDGIRDAALDRLAQARDSITTILYLTLAAGALLVLLTALLLRVWVMLPLRRLSRAVRAVAAGEHHRRIAVTGPPDLTEVAADAERMRLEIVTRLEEAGRAHEALEQQGPTVLSLRSHLQPSTEPLPPRLAVGVNTRPAQGVLAGDWYDLFAFDERTVAACLVDVAGHGPEAGVLALRAKQLLLAGLRDGRGPGETLLWTARHLGDTGELFLTAFVMLLDVRTGTCRYANAGHPPAYVLGGGRFDTLEPTGPLLGPIDSTWATAELDLDLDSMIVVCTDGVLEARNGDGEEFGAEGLLQVASVHHLDGPHEVAARCLDAALAFAGGQVADDLTILALALSPRRVHLMDTPSANQPTTSRQEPSFE